MDEVFENNFDYVYNCSFGTFGVIKCEQKIYQVRIEKSGKIKSIESIYERLNEKQKNYLLFKKDCDMLITFNPLFKDFYWIFSNSANTDELENAGKLFHIFTESDCVKVEECNVMSDSDKLPRVTRVIKLSD